MAFPCRLANGLEGVRIESKGRLSTLTFFNVSEKDYGNYTCVATNKLGNTNASIILYGRCALFFAAKFKEDEQGEDDGGEDEEEKEEEKEEVEEEEKAAARRTGG